MNWRQIQRRNFTRWRDLQAFLELPSHLEHVKPDFPLNLPRRLAEKIEKGNLNDPILRQFLPTQEEDEHDPLFLLDPVADKGQACSQRLIRKYQGRALLITTGACAMHCRYCFRQNYDYPINKDFEQEIAMIGEDRSLHEIILSGGDPLSLPDHMLASLVKPIAEFEHVRLIRFHTRFPIGIPERITDDFLEVLRNKPVQFSLVVHVNHPRELDADIAQAMRLLQQEGVLLLNQSVLLRDVNDDVATLRELSFKLLEMGVFPYYLHQLDRVHGSKHFEVEQERGLELIEEMRKSMPGYALPQYVQEVPYQASKMPLHTVHGLQTENV